VAMELLSRGPGGEEPPPPLDFLLGHSGASAAAVDFRPMSGELVSSAGQLLGRESLAPLGLPGDPSLMDIGAEDPLASTTPRRLVKRLEEEFNSPIFAGDEQRLARASTQSSYLARMLEFSPDVPEPLEAPLQAPDAGDVDSAVVAPPAQTPQRQRRKRLKPWLDEQTEIPKAEYHDTSAITREPLCDYRLFLPHRAPHVGLTTTLSDICPLLCEPLLHAPEVGLKRRRALTEASSRPVIPDVPPEASASSSAPAPIPAGAESATPVPDTALDYALEGVAEAVAEAVPSDVEAALEGERREDALASLPPTPRHEEDEEPEPVLPPWIGGELLSPRSEGAADSAMASPLRSASPLPLGRDEADEGLDSDRDLDEAEASPLPFAPFSPLLQLAEDGREEPDPALTEAGVGVPAPTSPEAGGTSALETDAREGMTLVQTLPDAPLDPGAQICPEGPPPKVRRTAEAVAEAVAQQAAYVQAGQLQEFLGSLETDVSLLDLCSTSEWGAEDVAQSFMGLLTLHMEGAVSLTQVESYGDIIIGRGADWPTPPDVHSADA